MAEEASMTSDIPSEVRSCSCAGVDSRTYALAVRAWLHGDVLRDDQGLLVPGDVTSSVVAEAQRRQSYGAVQLAQTA